MTPSGNYANVNKPLLTPSMSSFHLKGLNSYRAMAALVVLIGHVELFKNQYGFENALSAPFFKYTGGHIGVILFFALSGYLITTLLLREKNKYSNIDLKKFYLRRIFRVWPLYYLILLITVILFNFRPSISTAALYLSIFPNVAHALNTRWTVSPQIWSIGVEEQFYLGWPWIVKKSNYLLAIFIGIFFLFTLLPYFPVKEITSNAKIIDFVKNILYLTKFNCMAAGGIMAVLYQRKSIIVKWLNYNTFISYLFIVLPFVFWFTGFHVNYVTDELYALLFAISILNVSTSPKTKDIDTKIGTFLGTISYGIYMYHWLILELFFRNDWLTFSNSIVKNVELYTLVIMLTILTATLSYYFIEKRFLKIKDKYARN